MSVAVKDAGATFCSQHSQDRRGRPEIPFLRGYLSNPSTLRTLRLTTVSRPTFTFDASTLSGSTFNVQLLNLSTGDDGADRGLS
jgi:hypothetical protein